MNEADLDPADSELSARIASYELAFRMQAEAPEAVDLADETEPRPGGSTAWTTRRTADFGTRCLLARRLVERGVRFVQVYSGGGPVAMQWDAHDDVDANHEKMCGLTDRPVAALLTDLKRRGLLDETLVVWGGEFGRTPVSQGGSRGRDHNATGFTMWMAGGGVKGGTVLGATDEIGLHAVEEPAPRQRPARDDPAPDGPRPHPPDVPAQRPRRAADGRRRPGPDRPARLSTAGRRVPSRGLATPPRSGRPAGVDGRPAPEQGNLALEPAAGTVRPAIGRISGGGSEPSAGNAA